MKKIISTSLIFCSIALAIGVNAQSCGNSGPSACQPNLNITTPGFENPDSVPCAIQGEPYIQSIYFKTFTMFNYLGSQTVDSIKFTGITNLPCGICWASNHSDNVFLPNDLGCISLVGTTNDTAGQYLLAVTLTAWINGGSTGFPIPAGEVNQAGIYLWDRVQNSAGNCGLVDTASGYSGNLTAHTGCPTVITGVNNDISLLSIMPNPLNSSATLTFSAIKAATYQLRITDVTGRIVSSRQLQAPPGENTSVIERNSLPAGIYFMSLTDGQSVTTRKFVITD